MHTTKGLFIRIGLFGKGLFIRIVQTKHAWNKHVPHAEKEVTMYHPPFSVGM